MDDKELQLKFLQFLAKKSGAKTQQDLEKYVQSLGEDGLKKAYDEFTKSMSPKKAAHGAKLNYIKNLKNKCADDEELYYFKKGGNLDCGCKKIQKGGEAPKKKEGIIQTFKRKMKEAQDTVDKYKNQPKEGWDKHGNYIVSKKAIEQRKKEMKNQKDEDEEAIDGINKGIGKNCGGSKLKLAKKGGEVCPKCGKVHAASMGCTVAKFNL